MSHFSKLFFLVLVALLLTSVTIGQTFNVTFNVNVATSPKLITDTSKVQVRGSKPQLGPWGDAPGNRMTNVSGDLWRLTVAFSPNDTVEYKFYAEDWEDGPNYSIIVTKDTVLPVRFFRKQGFGPGPPYTPSDSIDVWFRVYMFNITEYTPTDTVGVRGGRKGTGADVGQLSWGRTFFLAKEPDNANMWSGRVKFPAKDSIEYKFVIGSGPKKWEGDPNRSVVFSNDTTLKWVTFDRKVIAPAKPVQTYFSVNMSVFAFAGFFRPDSGDVVLVRGTFNGWGEDDQLTPSAIELGIWEKTKTITAAQGDFIEYKYYIKTGTNNPARVPNGGWESGSNYRYDFTAADRQDIPRRYFNNAQPQDFVQKEKGVEVWFYADMNNVSDNAGNPITQVDSLFIAGSHPPLFWIWDEPTRDRSALRLRDNGVSPDLVAGDKIYSVALTFPKWTAKGPLQFKFAVNGTVDNEAGFQEDHMLFLNDLPGQPGEKARNVLEVVKFGRQRGQGAFKDTVRIVQSLVVSVRETGEIPLTYSLSQNYPNPFNPSTTIEYSIPTEGFVTLKLYNLLGQEVATLIEAKQPAGKYVVTFDASNLPTGLYFYRIASGKFVETRKMLLIR